MPVFTPHGPVHEETEFWYDTKEKALLYEVNILQGHRQAEPDHTRTRERGRLRGDLGFYHYHSQPHGICFADLIVNETQGRANLENIELVIRLWCQMETNEQPVKTGFYEPLIPVPKILALFLAARRTQMYRDESLTQAFALLNVCIAAKGNSQLPSS